MKFIKHLFPAILLIGAVGTWQACTTINPDNIVWEPEFLGPVVYTVIDPVEIANASNDTVVYDNEAADLQINNFNYNQSINTGTVGPVDLPPKYEPLFDLFAKVTIVKGTVNLWFENTWPIAVGAGTHLVGEDSLAGPIFDHVIPNDVPPGGFYQVQIPIANKDLQFGLIIQFRDFVSPGGNNVVFDSTNTLDVMYDFGLEEFSIALAKPSKQYVLEDESTFKLALDGDSVLGENPEGTLSFFLENNLPSQIDLEMKLLNSQGDTVYSFFNGQPVVLPAPDIDGSGYTVAPTKKDLIDAVQIADITNIQDAAYLYTHTVFKTPTDPILVVNNDNYIRIQLTADLKVKLN